MERCTRIVLHPSFEEYSLWKPFSLEQEDVQKVPVELYCESLLQREVLLMRRGNFVSKSKAVTHHKMDFRRRKS